MKEKIINNQVYKRAVDVLEYVYLFFISMVIVAPVIGVLSQFLSISWSFLIVGIIFVSSIGLTIVFKRFEIFKIRSLNFFIMILLLTVFSIFIFIQFAPILELRQDPSVYMAKALNLVKHGFLYAPADELKKLMDNGLLTDIAVEGYSSIQNGMQYVDGKILVDFYPGGAFFYAIFGMIKRSYIFYGQTAISVLNIYLMLNVVNKICKNKNSMSHLFYVMAFAISPIIVYFGRGSYSEPFALFYILLIINLLFNDKIPATILLLVFLSSYSSRIDYLLILMLGAFIITYKSQTIGLIYTLLGSLEIFIYSKLFYIYYDRITANDMPILKYSIVLLFISYIISLVIARWGKEILNKIYYSTIIRYLLVIFGVGLTLFIFRDNIVSASNYEVAIIHGQELLTYVEKILDLLSLVFPGYILIIGLVGIYNFIFKKQLPFLVSCFMLGSFVAYSYFLLKAGNSPQLYWMLRRYYNIIIPLLFISFVLVFSHVGNNVSLVLAFSTFVFSLNMYLNNTQIPDYEGLDTSVCAISQDLESKNIELILYDENLRYDISSLMSFCEIEMVPTNMENLEKIIENEEYANRNIVWLSSLDIEHNEKYEINYYKMGETYGSVPTDIYERNISYYCYSLDDIKEIMNEKDEYIYPCLSSEEASGFYDDGQWIAKELTIKEMTKDIDNNENIVIEMYDYDKYYIDNGKLDKQNIQLILNDDHYCELLKCENNKLYFSTKGYRGEINKIHLTCNTYNLMDITGDSRDLGLPIKAIRIAGVEK